MNGIGCKSKELFKERLEGLADVVDFLKEIMPYYKSEDKDTYHYLLNGDELEIVGLHIYTKYVLKNKSAYDNKGE